MGKHGLLSHRCPAERAPFLVPSAGSRGFVLTVGLSVGVWGRRPAAGAPADVTRSCALFSPFWGQSPYLYSLPTLSPCGLGGLIPTKEGQGVRPGQSERQNLLASATGSEAGM